MEIIPSIDLKDGKVVRLTKGLMESAKIYSEEPWALAHKFEELGSKWLHVVDLDGAFAGEPKNLKEIEKIRENCSLKIQIGGGIRDEESVKRYLDIGIDRVILGSVALRYPEFVEKMAQKYRIIVGIDAIGGYVVVNGWANKSHTRADTLAAKFRDIGVEGIICTDVSRDGMLSGANVEFTERIAKASGILTIASGGVKDLADIEALTKSSYIGGVIIGKAYYEGKIDLTKAFSLVKSMD